MKSTGRNFTVNDRIMALTLLALPEGASPAEIEQAFKFLSLAFHPDRFPGKWRPLANEKMIAIIAAREALRNYNNQPSSQNQEQKARRNEKGPASKKWQPVYSSTIELCNGGQCRDLFIQPDEPCILVDEEVYFHPWCWR
jgi:DnaJ-class molecular chaperone